jgi:hypothetical protein
MRREVQPYHPYRYLTSPPREHVDHRCAMLCSLIEIKHSVCGAFVEAQMLIAHSQGHTQEI